MKNSGLTTLISVCSIVAIIFIVTIISVFRTNESKPIVTSEPVTDPLMPTSEPIAAAINPLDSIERANRIEFSTILEHVDQEDMIRDLNYAFIYTSLELPPVFGDVFHGSFRLGLLRKWDLRETIRFASAAAALKCREIGGRTAIPDLREVEEFLEEDTL